MSKTSPVGFRSSTAASAAAAWSRDAAIRTTSAFAASSSVPAWKPRGAPAGSAMRTAKPFRRKKRAKRRPMRPAPPTRRTTRFVPRFGFPFGGYFLRRRRGEAAAQIGASRRHPDEPLAHSQKNALAGADAQRGCGRVHLRPRLPVLGRRHRALADLLACDVLARRKPRFHEDVRHVPFKEIFGALSRRASGDRRKPHDLCLHRSTRPREPRVELGTRRRGL